MTSATAKPIATLLILAAIVGGCLGIWLLGKTQPQHEATAVVRVSRDATDSADLGALAPKGTEAAVFLQNQTEIIRSDAVVQKVGAKFKSSNANASDLNGGDHPNSHEVIASLRERINATANPADSILQITARDENEADSIALANLTAEAFRDYRAERRRYLAQEKITAVETPFRENEAKVKKAREAMDTVRQQLPGEWQATPPNADVEEQKLKKLRGDLNRITMSYMAQTNRLALSQSLPAQAREPIKTQVTKTADALTNTLAAVTAATLRQSQLRDYWAAALELEKAEKVFAPIASLVATNQAILADPNPPTAQIIEIATTAKLRPAPARNIAQGCLIGAGALVGAAILILIQPRKTSPTTG